MFLLPSIGQHSHTDTHREMHILTDTEMPARSDETTFRSLSRVLALLKQRPRRLDVPFGRGANHRERVTHMGHGPPRPCLRAPHHSTRRDAVAVGSVPRRDYRLRREHGGRPAATTLQERQWPAQETTRLRHSLPVVVRSAPSGPPRSLPFLPPSRESRVGGTGPVRAPPRTSVRGSSSAVDPAASGDSPQRYGPSVS